MRAACNECDFRPTQVTGSSAAETITRERLAQNWWVRGPHYVWATLGMWDTVTKPEITQMGAVELNG